VLRGLLRDGILSGGQRRRAGIVDRARVAVSAAGEIVAGVIVEAVIVVETAVEILVRLR
jgi:hypothetical protein